jgi:uncharacterized protein (DUF1499 family)
LRSAARSPTCSSPGSSGSMRAMLAWLRPLAALLALATLLLLVLSGPGVRFGAFDYRTGLTIFRTWTFYAAIAAGAVALLALLIPSARSRGAMVPVVALVIALAALYPSLAFQSRARSHPPINDITTDTQDPPAYMTTARAYPGADMARQQRAAYADIVPVMLPMPPAQAFAKALAVAEAMGWEVVGRDAAGGRIEAVDSTKWFGFKDDIAIRVRAADAGSPNLSRVDIRSKSRVGRGDLGTNAQRIRAYVQRLK